MTLGQKIYAERCKQDISWKQLSEMTDIRFTRIVDIECERVNPSQDEIRSIAIALGLTASDLGVKA